MVTGVISGGFHDKVSCGFWLHHAVVGMSDKCAVRPHRCRTRAAAGIGTVRDYGDGNPAGCHCLGVAELCCRRSSGECDCKRHQTSAVHEELHDPPRLAASARRPVHSRAAPSIYLSRSNSAARGKESCYRAISATAWQPSWSALEAHPPLLSSLVPARPYLGANRLFSMRFRHLRSDHVHPMITSNFDGAGSWNSNGLPVRRLYEPVASPGRCANCSCRHRQPGARRPAVVTPLNPLSYKPFAALPA